jgi:hypothetical protein
MLTSDKLIFVELQKAGSTALKKFLGNIVGGESTGKTSVYADELLTLGKPIVGLVCHPLVWYLDQWRQGCGGKGELYKRLVDQKRWDLVRSRRTNVPAKAKESSKPRSKTLPENWGAEYAKNHWYGDENNADAFREWLDAVVGSRGIRNVIDHGFQVSPVSKVAGLMTYHYVIRFLRDGENMERSVDTLDALRTFVEERAITTHFVRAEYAGEDLLRVLDALGIETTSEQREQAAQFKRRGAEAKLVRQFYDDSSMRLVAEHEELMGELFGYELVAPGGLKPGKQKDKPEKAGKGKPEGKEEDGPKLSKEERALKREARSERRAAKEAKGAAKGAKMAKGTEATLQAQSDVPAAAISTPAAAAATPPGEMLPAETKPVSVAKAKGEKTSKTKRAKSRPVDDDIVETEA